jgi:hypothetical protein
VCLSNIVVLLLSFPKRLSFRLMSRAARISNGVILKCITKTSVSGRFRRARSGPRIFQTPFMPRLKYAKALPSYFRSKTSLCAKSTSSKLDVSVLQLENISRGDSAIPDLHLETLQARFVVFVILLRVSYRVSLPFPFTGLAFSFPVWR